MAESILVAEEEKENLDKMESMKDYERELEASFRKIQVGDIIKGTVIAVNEEEVVLDLRYYNQGIIKAEDLSADPGFVMQEEIHLEDEIEATVVSLDDGQGNILLSRKEANEVLAWDVFKGYMEQETKLSVKVNEAVNGGAVAYLEGTVESLQTYGAFIALQDGLGGLVHISQISQKRIKKPSEVLKVGDKVKVKVLNTNEGKISLSIKAVEEEREAEEMESLEAENYSSDESVGTSLGDLFAKLKL